MERPILAKAPAKSILEFLTTENCQIENQTPNSKSLTSKRTYYHPKKLKKWDEFNIKTMEEIYNGKLMEEARKKDCNNLFFPILDPFDCMVSDESGTLNVLIKWTNTIVTRALRAVEHTLHPSIWIAKRGGTKMSGGWASKSQSRLKPDAGAVAACDKSQSVERLPKDYKTASKWNSEHLRVEFLDENGDWKEGATKDNYTMPIAQVYTYCLTSGCRYGCIVSTSEAFIFRIKPLETRPGKTSKLKNHLAQNGVMEFVSIPWEKHNKEHQGEIKELTMNLALWFVHILAGNNHKLGWSYPTLLTEKLATHHVSSLSMPNAEANYCGPDESQDMPNLSFISSASKRKRSIGSPCSETQTSCLQDSGSDTEPSTEDEEVGFARQSFNSSRSLRSRSIKKRLRKY